MNRFVFGIAILALGLGPSNAAAQAPAALIGPWAVQGSPCASASDALMRIERDKVQYREHSCAIRSARQEAATVILETECEGEGNRWASVLRLTPHGNRLTVRDSNQARPADYQRCARVD